MSRVVTGALALASFPLRVVAYMNPSSDLSPPALKPIVAFLLFASFAVPSSR